MILFNPIELELDGSINFLTPLVSAFSSFFNSPVIFLMESSVNLSVYFSFLLPLVVDS